MPQPLFNPDDLDAVIFDLDGVLTDTATAHRAAWKELFDEFLRRRFGPNFEPFSQSDYRRWVDGKPRFDGIRSFLASRKIELPEGSPSDAAGFDSVYALGREKNRRYHEHLEGGEVEVFEDSVDCARRLLQAGLALGLVSSSRNAKLVLELAGLDELFSTRVDGLTLAEEGLKGKPDPQIFVEAARRLGATPDRTAIVEDAESGVQAGKAGAFALVVGIARGDEERRSLLEHGADVVVETLKGCV